MANADELEFNLGENSAMNNGIEANDLVSLLSRFEEATKPADDLSISSSANVKRKNLFLRAKSAGNSPAITPPATPPPIVNPGMVIMRGKTKQPQSTIFFSGSNLRSVDTKLLIQNCNTVKREQVIIGSKNSTYRTLQMPMFNGQMNAPKMVQVVLQGPGKQLLQHNLQSSQPVVGQSLLSILKSKQGEAKETSFQHTNLNIPVSLSPASFTQSLLGQEIKSSTAVSTGLTQVIALQSGVMAPYSNPKVKLSNGLPQQTLCTAASRLTHSASMPVISSATPKPMGSVRTDESDHDYCFFKTNWKNSPSMDKGKLKCGTEPSCSSLHSSTTELGGLELTEEASVPLEVTALPQERPEEEIILEEIQVFVDANGNDALLLDSCDSNLKVQTESPYNNITFSTSRRNAEGKRIRKYRHRKISTSHKPPEPTPAVEDEPGQYYEKIPNYYTALSIPMKPMKTTVFATATNSIGRSDHLDLEEKYDPVEESHYDKVPAHRRCFTNTTKDVELEDIEKESVLSPAAESNLKCSQSPGAVSQHSSRCNSPCSPRGAERRSRSTSRRSWAGSRSSFRSNSASSDCSTCSTCSSRSYCSTCTQSSMSRSRSRSASSCHSSSSSSCSGSRSPVWRRERRLRSHRTRSRFTPNWEPRSRSRSRSLIRKDRSRSSPSSHRKKSHSGNIMSEKRKAKEIEREKAMEERRVVYVGKIPNAYSKKQLYQRFQCFGEIKEVKLNFREHGDNYGFVTFAYACDAIAAKERGNNTPDMHKFDLCFGGRRRFCPDQYADLDGNNEIEEEYAPLPKRDPDEIDYAALLKQHSTQQRKKK
ncbi:unnamed protein product [Lymnaea stagnalis]|uniref:RRM domain-containing protein n=1 Tax=Lymnaea stagnalis TaxID=6523 RepID=A0AAV2GXV2_LYMST